MNQRTRTRGVTPATARSRQQVEGLFTSMETRAVITPAR